MINRGEGNIVKIAELLYEGGHVFLGKTAPINRENITPTLEAYFSELKKLFPKKSKLFNTSHFIPLGSVGKKAMSGDIDLGVSSLDLLDKTMSDASIAEWGIDPALVQSEFLALEKRAQTSSSVQLRMKAFLKVLSKLLNVKSENIQSNEKKITPSNMFMMFPQSDNKGHTLNLGVQIDWMVGNLDWLKFSYHSSEYPKESNVKGLHRTLLLMMAFQLADLSFDFVHGVKDKQNGEILATDSNTALKVLSERLGFKISSEDAENFYSLKDLLKKKMASQQYRMIIDKFYQILDGKRDADVPDTMQSDWLKRKGALGLTGRFLPDTSSLKKYA